MLKMVTPQNMSVPWALEDTCFKVHPWGGRRSQHPGSKRWAPGAGGGKALARTPGRNCSAMRRSLPIPLVPGQVPKAWA